MRASPKKPLAAEILEQEGAVHALALEAARLQSRLAVVEQQLEQLRHRAADQETVLNLTRPYRERIFRASH